MEEMQVVEEGAVPDVTLVSSPTPIPNFATKMHRMICFGAEKHPQYFRWTPKGDAFEVNIFSSEWKELVKQFFGRTYYNHHHLDAFVAMRDLNVVVVVFCLLRECFFSLVAVDVAANESQFWYQMLLHGWWQAPYKGGSCQHYQYWHLNFHRDQSSPDQLALIEPQSTRRSEFYRRNYLVPNAEAKSEATNDHNDQPMSTDSEHLQPESLSTQAQTQSIVTGANEEDRFLVPVSRTGTKPEANGDGNNDSNSSLNREILQLESSPTSLCQQKEALQIATTSSNQDNHQVPKFLTVAQTSNHNSNELVRSANSEHLQIECLSLSPSQQEQAHSSAISAYCEESDFVPQPKSEVRAIRNDSNSNEYLVAANRESLHVSPSQMEQVQLASGSASWQDNDLVPQPESKASGGDDIKNNAVIGTNSGVIQLESSSTRPTQLALISYPTASSADYLIPPPRTETQPPARGDEDNHLTSTIIDVLQFDCSSTSPGPLEQSQDSSSNDCVDNRTHLQPGSSAGRPTTEEQVQRIVEETDDAVMEDEENENHNNESKIEGPTDETMTHSAYQDDFNRDDEDVLLCTEEMPEYNDDDVDMVDVERVPSLASVRYFLPDPNGNRRIIDVGMMGSPIRSDDGHDINFTELLTAATTQEKQATLSQSLPTLPPPVDPKLPTPVIHSKSLLRKTNAIQLRQSPAGVLTRSKNDKRADVESMPLSAATEEGDDNNNDEASFSEKEPLKPIPPNRLSDDNLWDLSENFGYNWDSLQLGDKLGSSAVRSLFEAQTLQLHLGLPSQKQKQLFQPEESSLGRRHHYHRRQCHYPQQQKIQDDNALPLTSLSSSQMPSLVVPEWNIKCSWQMILQSLPTKTIPPPVGSPLHDVALGTAGKATTAMTSSSSTSLMHVVSELYETMCRQEAAEAACSPFQDESRYWTASESLDHMRQMENAATELALRQERILNHPSHHQRQHLP
jgi:hypothetical protein